MVKVSMDDNMKLFLEKLNQITEDTGIYIKVYDDQGYCPTLGQIDNPDEESDTWISYDIDKKEYRVVVGNPYN
ncbi:hypothetical protein ACFVQB_14285 [Paenibacillus sp. NPDC057886]|uniref:hypothetical protein n=1 Tax=Paenibacillus sp. NPDC057886 TaxID=3346270 RepID=UPI0036BCA14E